MAGLTTGQDGALGLDRAFSSLSAFLNSNLRPDAIVEETMNWFFEAYDASHIVVSSFVRTFPASGIVTTELVDIESGVNISGVANTSQEPEEGLFDEIEASDDVEQPTSGEEQGPVAGSSLCSDHVFSMAARFVGSLSLIVIPGVLLGVVTGHLPWGLALCGGIATVLSFLVGLDKS